MTTPTMLFGPVAARDVVALAHLAPTSTAVRHLAPRGVVVAALAAEADRRAAVSADLLRQVRGARSGHKAAAALRHELVDAVAAHRGVLRDLRTLKGA